jgi:hypothetical protein
MPGLQTRPPRERTASEGAQSVSALAAAGPSGDGVGVLYEKPHEVADAFDVGRSDGRSRWEAERGRGEAIGFR